MKMEFTEYFEMSAHKIQMLGNYPKERKTTRTPMSENPGT
jgi:hypothetical protein